MISVFPNEKGTRRFLFLNLSVWSTNFLDDFKSRSYLTKNYIGCDVSFSEYVLYRCIWFLTSHISNGYFTDIYFFIVSVKLFNTDPIC